MYKFYGWQNADVPPVDETFRTIRDPKALYDMLCRTDLSKAEIKKVKEVAATLIKKIKAKIAELDHWTDKQDTRTLMDVLIRNTLWEELPECYDDKSVAEYRRRIYEYVYTRYSGAA